MWTGKVARALESSVDPFGGTAALPVLRSKRRWRPRRSPLRRTHHAIDPRESGEGPRAASSDRDRGNADRKRRQSADGDALGRYSGDGEVHHRGQQAGRSRQGSVCPACDAWGRTPRIAPSTGRTRDGVRGGDSTGSRPMPHPACVSVRTCGRLGVGGESF